MTAAQLSDLEITRLCAAIAEPWKRAHEWYPTMTLDATFKGAYVSGDRCYLMPNNPMRQDPQEYRPLTDKAQAMDLVIALELDIEAPRIGINPEWEVYRYEFEKTQQIHCSSDLLRAICLCAAKLQQAKERK